MKKNNFLLERKWKIKDSAPEDFLRSFPEIPRAILQLLWNRHLTTKEEIYKFLNPSLHYLLEPEKLLNMEIAGQRIKKAIENKEKIAIYADYDTDGVCSAVILAQFFKRIGFENFSVFIPNRFKEGYGLNFEKIKLIKELGIKLIITLDCGVSDFEEVNFAQSLGMEVLIFDHHLVLNKAPKTLIVDPNQAHDPYPFKFLVSSALSYKLVLHLAKILNFPYRASLEKQFLDLVAIATIADVAPLLGENRVLVKFGLEQLKTTQNLGLRKLLELTGLVGAPKYTPFHLAYIIAPRLNAVGRVEHHLKETQFEQVDYSFALLMSESEEEAEFFARRVEELNLERQEQVQKIYEELSEFFKENKPEKFIFLGKENWSKGVIGIIAGRLKDEWQRPVFIYSLEGDLASGSARSIPQFDLGEFFLKYQDLFIEAGGHSLAGGFDFSKENEEKIREALRKESEKLKEEDIEPVLEIETLLEPSEIDERFMEFFSRFEPFGRENPEPIFLMPKVKIYNPRLVGNNSQHLKFTLQKDGRFFEVISFNNAERIDSLSIEKEYDVVFSLKENQWQGMSYLDFLLIDFKPHY